MGYIFISYSRRDSQFVDSLRVRLERNGIQVWVDRTDIQGGSKWRSEIVKAIEGAESTIVVLSRHSIQSDNVRKELDITESQKAKIIPVEIELVEIPSDFKYQLAGLQRIKIGNDFEAGFSQLLDALRKSPKSHQNQSIPYQTAPTYIPENYKTVIYKYSPLIKDKNIYFLSAIPEKILSKVYQLYARNALAMNEIPLCLVDGKSYYSGKYGLLITHQALYWRDSAIGSGKSIALRDIISIEPIPILSLGNGGLRINNKINIYYKKHLKFLASMIQELARL